MADDLRGMVADARDEALAQIESVADASPAEKGAGEEEAVHTFADTVADALLEGFGESSTGVHVSAIADTADYFNKTDVQGVIQEKVEAKKQADRRPFNEVLETELEEVVTVKTTDHKQDATYRWDFGTATVETQSGKDGRGHFSWPDFRDMYLEATGNDAAKPVKDLRSGDTWRQFVVEQMETKERVVETKGPRTAAVEELQNHIRNATGYPTLGDMIDRNGVYVDVKQADTPEWWAAFGSDDGEIEPTTDNVRRIGIQSQLAQRVAENNGISTRALQLELDGRDYTTGYDGSVSAQKYYGQTVHSYWELSAELALPNEYEPAPETATEATERELEEMTTDTDGETPEATADGGDDGDDGGMGTVGGLGGEL
ncbi:hypothetical protein M0R89_10435 [Halorussus limi]|uniref:Uncharacterized protein n=1 Tax=Halorussus limi TaxID=2938695 RepID=A0A8U0HPJ1_9EURY|nr:hypothetical protein [Halorussus limi]UPV72965.1 hypothetical protein M0R89_10435 [Halorussus limi]